MARTIETAFGPIVPGFHLRSGLHFQRGDEGEVTIVKTDGQAFDPVIQWEVVVPAEEWASVVASVGARGETGDTWREALAYHQDPSIEG